MFIFGKKCFDQHILQCNGNHFDRQDKSKVKAVFYSYSSLNAPDTVISATLQQELPTVNILQISCQVEIDENSGLLWYCKIPFTFSVCACLSCIWFDLLFIYVRKDGTLIVPIIIPFSPVPSSLLFQCMVDDSFDLFCQNMCLVMPL